MKILVISDTHGYVSRAQSVIEENMGIDLLIHLGDYLRDARLLENLFPQIPMEYVYGNCDFSVGDVSDEKLLEYGGKKIFITHGHRYAVKRDCSKLRIKAGNMKADLLLFGHTHNARILESGGISLVNPGSLSEPRGGSGRSYAIIEIENGFVNPRIVYV